MKNFILYLFSFCVLSFLSVFFSTNEETFADESIRFFDGNTTIEFQNEEEFEQYLLEESQKIDIVDESLIDEGEMSDCFNYYTFQSIQTRIAPEKDSFVAGEEINFTGKIENENPYPIFNGYLYVRIAEKNPNYIEEGHNIIDEFFALGSIAIDTESSIPVSFTWRIPDNLKFGEYTIDYFFSVNKRMNLSGLPFTNEIIAGFSEFTVSSNEEGGVYFLKESTTVNGEKYNHIGDWPFLNSGGEAFVSQQIVNSSDEDINSTISYNLYFWDSLDAEDRISSRTEEILLQPGENKTLTYEIPQIEESVYYLQIIAENDNGTKSIVNIRITSDISKPRINYFGLDKFPIQEGDLVTLYSCFHNTSHGSLPTGKTVLTARDETGEDIASVIYEGMIPSEIFSNKKVFTAEDDLNYLVLHHELYDENEVLIEYQEIIYDMSLIRDDFFERVPLFQEETSNINDMIYIVVLIIGLLIAIVLIWLLIKPKLKNKNVTNNITSLIVFALIFLTFFLSFTQTSKAQSTINNFLREQSSLVNRTFSTDFVRRAVIREADFLEENNITILHLTPNEIYGGASYRYNICTTAQRPLLAVDETFNFYHSTRDFYYLSGATYDTPHLGQKITIRGKLTLQMEAAKWVPSGSSGGRPCNRTYSSQPSECVGGTLNCESDFSHDWQHQGRLESYTEFLKQFSNENFAKIYNSQGDHRPGYRKEPDIPRPMPTTSNNPNVIDCSSGECVAVGPGTAILTPSISPSEVILGYSCPIPIGNVEISFPGFRPTWEFKVVEELDPEIPLCGNFNQQTYPEGQNKWPEISSTSFCEQGELHEDYKPQPKYPQKGNSVEWKCVGTDKSEINCKAARADSEDLLTCGTYHNRIYPGFMDCDVEREGFEGYRWSPECWLEHNNGSGNFCERGNPQPAQPDFPFPDSYTTWYCVDGVSVSPECHASRGGAEPWIATQGGLVHIEGSINLDIQSILYKDILGKKLTTDENMTSISSELLTSTTSIPQAGASRSTETLGWTEKIYTLGNYNKSINRSWYELLLNKAESQDPSGELWSKITSTGGLDLDKCKNGNRHIYFVDMPNFVVDPSIYKNLSKGGIDGCIFIVNQNMTITKGDYESEGKQDTQYDIVRGFFLVDGVITIEEDGVGEGTLQDGLKVVGGLFATGGGKSINMNRNLGIHNVTFPALILFHDARYLNIAHELFGDIVYIRDVGIKE